VRELGVGLVYTAALTPLFESGDAAVLELEPQTLWTKVGASSGFTYRLNEPLFESIAALPAWTLMHGVGQPVGGSVDDPVDYLPLLRRMCDRLEPAWVSEHMSFNRIDDNGRVAECGFLMPPLQTASSVRVASANVRRYGQGLGRPVAFETGVNYFRPSRDELSEGAFFRGIAERANCGILLDLHNLWCNERNGRQSVLEAVDELPLDRVWEMHFAGGSLLDGFWLDAHSQGIDPELLDLAAQVVPRLTNIGALIFEILPDHVGGIGLDGVGRQLESLRQLWDMRPPRSIQVSRPSNAHFQQPAASDIAAVRAREVALMNGINIDEGSGDPLDGEPAYRLMRTLVRDFRSAALARGLRCTITALLAGLGVTPTAQLLHEYFKSVSPDPYAAVESHHFVRFLVSRPHILASVPYLHEIVSFEGALLAATLFGETTEVQWTADPTLLLDQLQAGRLPSKLPAMASRMTVTA